MKVYVTTTIQGVSHRADLQKPLPIGIPLCSHPHSQPNAFGAPPFEAAPVVSENFVGSTQAGGPVNFNNWRINPHGNGTHTECVGHIAIEPHYLPDELNAYHFIAQLVTVEPVCPIWADAQIVGSLLPEILPETTALVIRTWPNPEEKKTRQWSGTQPPYVEYLTMAHIVQQGIDHLLIDLPSVDPEIDGGLLAAHHEFWKYPYETRKHATITEMIYVDNSIEDGLYLLNIQIPCIRQDACPSMPVLYALNPLP